jgi:hypothetical protein
LKQAQLPAWHVVPPLHTVPQTPQLALSVCRSTQDTPHAASPAPHVSWHMPATHCWLPAHCTPQPPQLFGSVCVFAHPAPHADSPAGQLQAPAEQLSPARHAFPHAPQSFALV